LEGHERGGQAIAGKARKNEPISVIIMRRHGRMYTTDLSPRLLILSLLFFIAFAVLGVTSINRYAALSLENEALEQKLADRERRLAQYAGRPRRVLEQYARLEDELNRSEQPGLEEVEQGEAQGDAEAAGRDADESAAEEPEPSGRSEEAAAGDNPPSLYQNVTGDLGAPEKPPVDADRLSVMAGHDNKSLRFQYSLSNIDPGDDPVSGYLFLILANEDTNPPTTATYPEVELADGLPADFTKGTVFSIRHGKTVRGRFKGLENASGFDKAWVLAFDNEGRILMKKKLPINDG
jgi:hypothetical protein